MHSIGLSTAILLTVCVAACGPNDIEQSLTIERGVYGRVSCVESEPDCDREVPVTVFRNGRPFGLTVARASDGFYEEELWPGIYTVCFAPDFDAAPTRMDHCGPNIRLEADALLIRCDFVNGPTRTVLCEL